MARRPSLDERLGALVERDRLSSGLPASFSGRAVGLVLVGRLLLGFAARGGGAKTPLGQLLVLNK